jgi:hypothetical protein
MQHGFIRGKSTTTQLLEVYHEILESVASGNEVEYNEPYKIMSHIKLWIEN